MFGFEVNHEYIIQYVEAFEHNSWTFEVHVDTFSVFQTVWGILYNYITWPKPLLIESNIPHRLETCVPVTQNRGTDGHTYRLVPPAS